MPSAGINDKMSFMKDLYAKIVLTSAAIGLCSCATVLAFDSALTKVTIDYLSFIAGIFLLTDGTLAFIRAKEPFPIGRFTRAVRISFGLSIIAIHLGQFLQFRVMSSEIAEIQINWVDYTALGASLFLIIEGLTKILASNSPLFPFQISRLLRVAIGSIVLTIHVLQFIHAW